VNVSSWVAPAIQAVDGRTAPPSVHALVYTFAPEMFGAVRRDSCSTPDIPIPGANIARRSPDARTREIDRISAAFPLAAYLRPGLRILWSVP
jgi:hypothetical protein